MAFFNILMVALYFENQSPFPTRRFSRSGARLVTMACYLARKGGGVVTAVILDGTTAPFTIFSNPSIIAIALLSSIERPTLKFKIESAKSVSEVSQVAPVKLHLGI